MAPEKHKEKPQRSCLACREVRDKAQLLRFVLSPQGEVVPDLDGRLPGRGAYCCNSRACVEKALKNKGFVRSFKADIEVSASPELPVMLERLMREKILGCLGLANKAGKIISGGSMVSDAIRGKTKPGIVLVAEDVSESIGEKIVELAKINGIPCKKLLSKDEFGAILGKAPRSAVAVKQGGFVERLACEIDRYRNFLGEV